MAGSLGGSSPIDSSPIRDRRSAYTSELMRVDLPNMPATADQTLDIGGRITPFGRHNRFAELAHCIVTEVFHGRWPGLTHGFVGGFR